MKIDEASTGWLAHPRELEHGKARVVYVTGYGMQPSAWWGPGGLRTTDGARAKEWAVAMDALMKSSAPRQVIALPVVDMLVLRNMPRMWP